MVLSTFQANGGAEKAVAGGEPDVRDTGHVQHEHRHTVDKHGHDHSDATGFSKLVAWLGKFHPASVHFPIALLIAAAIAEFCLMVQDDARFAHASRFCIWTGAAGAVIAAVLGWVFGGFHLGDDRWPMAVHRWLGTATAAWAVLVAFLGERAKYHQDGIHRTRYRMALMVGVVTVTVTGFFGGSLVYGLNHHAW